MHGRQGRRSIVGVATHQTQRRRVNRWSAQPERRTACEHQQRQRQGAARALREQAARAGTEMRAQRGRRGRERGAAATQPFSATKVHASAARLSTSSHAQTSHLPPRVNSPCRSPSVLHGTRDQQSARVRRLVSRRTRSERLVWPARRRSSLRCAKGGDFLSGFVQKRKTQTRTVRRRGGRATRSSADAAGCRRTDGNSCRRRSRAGAGGSSCS